MSHMTFPPRAMLFDAGSHISVVLDPMGEWYKTTLILCSCVAEACNVILGPVPVKKAFLSGIIHLLFRGHVHALGRPFFSCIQSST